ncbi:MAG: PQQ-dependent sugar dehydrogenase [Patescibacteria group bacterium]|nr:PQQ-dependent sugar dehydrogenase [Patescibacteria group bacterium]
MKRKVLIGLILVFAIGLLGGWVWLEFPELIRGNTPTADETEPEEAAGLTEAAPIKLAPVTVAFADGTQSTFQLAEPFQLAVAAEGLGRPRFMAMSPDGRMFVPDLVNMNLSREGKIYVLENFDETAKRFQTKRTYLSGLRGPNSIAFYTDKNGQGWIYIALTAHVIRYPYNAGDTKPSADPEIVAAFPNQQVPGESSVVWHITRTIKLFDDRLYVSVGSGCNACEQPEGEMRAMIYSMDPGGGDKRIYADGLRNAVGFTWAEGELYATVNGVDHLGLQTPDDVMYKLTEGEHYGWPYCYESNKEIYPDLTQKWARSFSCAQVPRSFSAFGPHTAPLGIQYFSKDAHPLLGNSFLVALHGSFEPEIGAGYHIVRVSKSGEKEVFMDGFLTGKGEQTGRIVNTVYAHTDQLTEDTKRSGRPVDILQSSANSFFFTDDYKGRIYYVYAE